MADTRELLERIAAFRRKLAETPTLVAPPPPVEAVTVAPANEPTVLTDRAKRLLITARELIAKQKQLGGESLVKVDTDPLAGYHRATVGLTETALKFAQQLPSSVEAQLVACEGLEHLLKVIDQRNDSLKQALAIRGADQQRLTKLSTLLGDLRAGRAITLNPFVELANEILDNSRRGSRLHFICPLEAAGPEQSALHFVAAHSLNVAAIIARLLPHDFEWAAKPILPVMAALVMDVGLAGLPDILFSTHEINVEERRRIEAHVREGANIIRTLLPDSGPLAEIVMAHHERPDGTGYPMGKVGEAIPALARFLAVANTYAALATARPHRAAMDSRSALAEVLMLAERGKLDRDFAEYLLNLSFHPVGTVVELVDGRLAVVAATHGRRADVRASTRPVVAILTDGDGTVKPRPEFLDLAAADRGGILRSVPRTESRARLQEWYPELCV